MKKLIFLILFSSQICVAQTALNRYEAEILQNPNAGKKDTREINSIIVFDKEQVTISSRRKKDQVFKEFKYSDILYVEHSFSRTPFYTRATKMAIMAVLTGFPLYFGETEKHWLTILTEDDFAVLKIENDNWRLIKLEFNIKKLEVENINENLQ